MFDQVSFAKGFQVLPDEVAAQCLALAEKWKGCDWVTKHGPLELNLQGMSASQAELMSRATAGPEAKEWRSAAKWLRQLELDIATITEEIRRAAFSIGLGENQRALEHVELASSIEGKYRLPVICQSLRDWLWQASESPLPNRTLRAMVASTDAGTKPTESISVS